MQQLPGANLGSTADSNSFLCELFLQQLPANVRMVLAFADPATELGKLAEMADKVLEVAAPTSIAAITDQHPKSPSHRRQPSSGSEIIQLCDKVAHLASVVESLASSSHHRNPSCSQPTSSAPQAQDSL